MLALSYALWVLIMQNSYQSLFSQIQKEKAKTETTQTNESNWLPIHLSSGTGKCITFNFSSRDAAKPLMWNSSSTLLLVPQK